jgi:thiamine-phosphate pyrophosphorylase
MNKKSVLRILDANLNRLKEALRVIEEAARLGRSDARLTHRLKALRHRVERAVRAARIPRADMLRARDSAGDVGKNSRIRDGRGTGMRGILTSNFKRAQESARVLEEFFKLHSETASRAFQRIRFEIYTLEKELL